MIPMPPIKEPINGMLSLPWLSYFTLLTNNLRNAPTVNTPLPNFVNDAAAAAGGVALYGYYRNGSIVMQRIV